MRRTVVALAAALCTAGALLPGLPARADEGGTTPPAVAPAGAPAQTAAEQALETAADLMEGDAGAAGSVPGAATEDVTLALRDLLVALPDLDGAARRRAEALLSRPTSSSGPARTTAANARSGGPGDCNDRIRVHHTTTGADAATDEQARTTCEVMVDVWRHVVALGYRPPLSDANIDVNDGDGRFDVYLKDTGAQGAYGYCAPQARASRSRAIGYCVLDNDFAEFGARPIDVLRVTAAHEFFHAVQFAYDYREDRWFMESTATWVEDTYADAVNDSRNYLRFSQLRRPWTPLDTYSPSGFAQYGNWIFWQYLTERHGNRLVRAVWEKAAPRNGRNRYSTQAVKAVLDRRDDFDRTFRNYAAANTVRAQAYAEGSAWPTARMSSSWRLRKGTQRQASTRLDHLAARHYLARPAAGLTGRGWRLRVAVDGPPIGARPSAVVIVRKKDGDIDQVRVRLNREGRGRTAVPFDRRRVAAVTVTLVNGSTRFRACGTRESDTLYSCRGIPVHDNQRFVLSVAAFRR